MTAVASPRAAPAVPRAAPVTDALHFDLYCDLHGHMVSDAHPEISHGNYPADEPTWEHHSHYIVDLQAMQICDSSACETYGPFPIVGATADRITLDDRPGITIFILRRGWRYEQRQEEMGRVDVTRGRCTRASFSGFPPRQAG